MIFPTPQLSDREYAARLEVPWVGRMRAFIKSLDLIVTAIDEEQHRALRDQLERELREVARYLRRVPRTPEEHELAFECLKQRCSLIGSFLYR